MTELRLNESGRATLTQELRGVAMPKVVKTPPLQTCLIEAHVKLALSKVAHVQPVAVPVRKHPHEPP